MERGMEINQQQVLADRQQGKVLICHYRFIFMRNLSHQSVKILKFLD